MRTAFLKLITLIFSFSFYTAQAAPQVAEGFSEIEKESVEKVFSTLKKLKGAEASDAFNYHFNPDFKFEGHLNGDVLVEFIEKRVKKIELLSEDDPTSKRLANSSYTKSAHVLPRVVEATDGAKHIIRDTVSVNKKYLDAKIGNVLALWGVFIHEAYHADADDEHAHENCPEVMIPIIEGTKTPAGIAAGCDSDEDGSYGLEAIFWGNILVHGENISKDAKEAVKFFFSSALEHIIDRDARYRVLDDLGLDEKLETKFVPQEKKEHLSIARDLRMLQKKLHWQEKAKATQKRNEQEREAFRSFLEEKRKVEEAARAEEQRKAELAASRDRALTILNFTNFDITFHYRWGRGNWIRKDVRKSENILLRLENTAETQLSIVFEPYQIHPSLKKKVFSEMLTIPVLPYPKGQKEILVPRYDFRVVDLGSDPNGYKLFKLGFQAGGHTRFKQ